MDETKNKNYALLELARVMISAEHYERSHDRRKWTLCHKLEEMEQ